jgi:hypothetical protein
MVPKPYRPWWQLPGGRGKEYLSRRAQRAQRRRNNTHLFSAFSATSAIRRGGFLVEIRFALEIQRQRRGEPYRDARHRLG